MQIDRSNYELWFIDWLDGNLSSNQVEQVKLFLRDNPDLTEEFNDLTSVTLSSPSLLFPDKGVLRKTPSEISRPQFEYLCAAYLENDLTDPQKEEVEDIAETHPDKKKTLDLILKTRLSPPAISYRNKTRLLKRTFARKVIRLSIIGLSAAAVIVFILLNYYLLPGNNPVKVFRSSHNSSSDTTLKGPTPPSASYRINTDKMPVTSEEKAESKAATSLKRNPVTASSELPETIVEDSKVRNSDDHDITINKVTVNSTVDLNNIEINNTLVASNQTISLPEAENERSRVGRFISKTFREKLLNEKTPQDSPIKGLDIAEAGVTGLNKLFGWQMALDKKNDENGQLKSVYFSSRILKFNAPVKKSEPLP